MKSVDKMIKYIIKLWKAKFKKYPTDMNGRSWCVLDNRYCPGIRKTVGGDCSSTGYCHTMKRSLDHI